VFTPCTFAPDIAGYDQMDCCHTRGLAKALGVNQVNHPELPTALVELVQIEAVFSKAVQVIAWHEPQDNSVWWQGWV
jgi:hypothetical protein